MMRKRISRMPTVSTTSTQQWLDIEQLAVVEVTSEDPSYPVESALLRSASGGWRAGDPGEQTIRLIFDAPQQLHRIQLIFEEHQFERSQEFILRWSSDRGDSFQEIVRQQWNFSPPGTTIEREDYRVDLQNVTVLELQIVPDMTRGSSVRASLEQMQLA